MLLYYINLGSQVGRRSDSKGRDEVWEREERAA